MAFWGLEVKPGKAPTPLSIERRLVIKQAALVVKAAKKSEPCVLSVRCSLRARRAPREHTRTPRTQRTPALLEYCMRVRSCAVRVARGERPVRVRYFDCCTT